MKFYDNAHPEGRLALDEADPHAELKAAQLAAFVRGTCPVCPDCGHYTMPEDALRDTPWTQMKPEAWNWDELTQKRLAWLRSIIAEHARRGQSKYVCVNCRARKSLRNR